MAMETACLRYVMEYLKKHYAFELELLEADVPVIRDIPSVTLLEAKEILGNKVPRTSWIWNRKTKWQSANTQRKHSTATLSLLRISRPLSRRSMQ